MDCEKCDLHLEPGSERYTVELCPLHEAAEELLKALKNLTRAARTYGTHNMGFAIEEAEIATTNAEK